MIHRLLVIAALVLYVSAQPYTCWTCPAGQVHWWLVPGVAHPADRCTCVPNPNIRNCWTCPSGFVHWYSIAGYPEPADKCACVRRITTTTTTARPTTTTARPTYDTRGCWTCPSGFIHWFQAGLSAAPNGDKCGCVPIGYTTPKPTTTTRPTTTTARPTTTTARPTTTTARPATTTARPQAMTPMANLLYYLTPSATSPGCVSFTPYVSGYRSGQSLSATFVRTLLTKLVTQTRFRCVQMFNLNPTWTSVADSLGIKVVGIVWLSMTRSESNSRIDTAISTIRQYPNTVIGLSCGSELAFRNGRTNAVINEVMNCYSRLKATGTKIPVGSNDAMPVWNKSWYDLSNRIDWIGVNIYPWYDNPATCMRYDRAAYQTYVRFLNVRSRYYGKPVILSEFGWVGGNPPARGCGIGSDYNQRTMVQGVLDQFRSAKLPLIVFSSWREPWKSQGPDASSHSMYFGFCSELPPYNCYGGYH